MEVLRLSQLNKTFGGVTAVSNLDLTVKEGEIRGIIGPNGAGKTTLFSLISGFYKPTSGTVQFRGENISSLRADEVAQRGLVRTFQRVANFPNMTVLENVEAAHHMQVGGNLFALVFGSRAQKEKTREDARKILAFIGMDKMEDELAGSLSHGHQRALGIANALAAGPTLLMLDEPVAGMNHTEKAEVTKLMARLRDEMGITLLLVEHDMRTVMQVSDTITVLSFGEKLAEGSPKYIRENHEVIDAYLGREEIFA